MDCSKVRDELVAYLDGELKGGVSAQVGAHLERCPACKLEAERLSAAGALLDALDEIEPASDFTARAMQRALSSRTKKARSRFAIARLLQGLFGAGRLIPAAAAAAVLVTLTLWLVAPTAEPPLTPVEEEIVRNMEILENMELLEDLEILREIELLLEYDEEDFESS